METEQAVDVQPVYDTIVAVWSPEPAVRGPAEARLRGWEEDAAPGFLSALLTIIEQSPDEATRLLAAVLAKNAVGSSWRKTLGTREWSRVPAEEKAGVRGAALRLLFAEPAERVAVQLAMLVTNIARFDFPGEWPALLQDLTAAAAWAAPTPVPAKARALRCLKNVVRALRGKRIVVEAPATGPEQDLQPLAARIAAERQLMNQQAEAVLGPLAAEWQAHCGALLQQGDGARGALAERGLLVLRELILLLPAWREGIAAFLQAGHAAAAALVTAHSSSKGFERILQCAQAAMDKHPLGFAPLLPLFLTLYGHTALVATSAAGLHGMRAKTRVLLTRFLARALLCPFYRADWLAGRKPGAAAQQEVAAAASALDELLAPERCGQLVEALVAKYIALTPEELAEWGADPEGYVRATDVESSPDADTPRPCGLALLLCMLERAPGAVAAALVALAGRLQAQALSPDIALAREACYRAIGEAYSQEAVAAQVDFPAWFDSELAGLLDNAADRILVSRAAWLVGTCGADLPAGPWARALAALVRHAGDADLVLALTAVSSLMALAAALLEQQHMVRAYEEQVTDEHAARMAALRAQGGGLLGALFALLGRLEHMESRVRVLQLVSMAVEVLGDAAQPHLGALAAALPQVWSACAAEEEEGDTGSVARLHSALVAVLTHIISRLGPRALGDAAFQAVLWPLLRHALDISGAESDTLVEEGLRLLSAAQAACAEEPPAAMMELLPALVAILRRGRDGPAVYTVLEACALLLGAPLAPYMDSLLAGMQRSIAALQQQLSREAVREADAACSLAAVLMQLLGEGAWGAFLPLLSAMAGAVAGLADSQPAASEGMLEVLARLLLAQPGALPSLLPAEAHARFLDTWLSMAGARYLEEVLGLPSMAALGRLRRRTAASALLTLVRARASAAVIDDLRRLGRTLALGTRAALEADAFAEDRPTASTDNDAKLLPARRLALAAAQPVWGIDIGAALREAFAVAAATHGSAEKVYEAVGWSGGELEAGLRRLVSSGG